MGIVDPLGPEGQVVHGEGGVASDLFGNLEEWRQNVDDILRVEGSEGLQEDQVPTPGVAGILVGVELKLLVVEHEAAPGFEDWVMSRVRMVQQVLIFLP